MNIEDQVCSLELSKRLKELRVKQKSLFWWRRWIPTKGSTYLTPEWKLSLFPGSTGIYEIISAFTSSELGEMLRHFEFKYKYEIDQYNTYNYFNIVLKPSKCTGEPSICIKEFTEVNARATMLIYLLENGLIKNENE